MTDFRAAPRRTNDSPIARLRIARGLTQTQLAELIGCPQQSINKWETRTRKPGMQSLVKLARALGCSIDDLIRPVTNLADITRQESGIVIYDNGAAIICNWTSLGDGLPHLLGDMLVCMPDTAEIIDHGVTDDFSEFDSASWDIIYDANNDAPNLSASASRWRWWKFHVTGEDADVLVIAPVGWN